MNDACRTEILVLVLVRNSDSIQVDERSCRNEWLADYKDHGGGIMSHVCDVDSYNLTVGIERCSIGVR